MKNINWDDIIAEWSYRLPKGFPTMKNGKFTVKSELKVLQEVLAENGINEMPDFTKKAPTPVREEASETPTDITLETLISTLKAANLEQSDLLQVFRIVDAKQTSDSVMKSLSELKNFTAVDSKLIFREAAETNSYKQLQKILTEPGGLISINTLVQMGEGNLFDVVDKTGVSKDFMQYVADLVPYTSVKMGRYEMFLRLFLEGGRSPRGGEAADVMVGDVKLEVKATKIRSGFRLRSQEKIGSGNDVAKYMTVRINQLFGGGSDIRQAEDPQQSSIPADILDLRAKSNENIYYLKKTDSWAFVAFERLLRENNTTLEVIKDIWASALAKVYKSSSAADIKSLVVDPAVEADGSVGPQFYQRLAAFEFYIYAGANTGTPHFDYFIAISGPGKFFMIDPAEDFNKLVEIFSTKFKIGSPTTSQKSQAQDVLTSVELKEDYLL